jgi:hypothetical protein
MQRHITRRQAMVGISKLAAVIVVGSAAPAFAKAPPKTNPPIELKNWSGQVLGVDPEVGLTAGDFPFTLSGTASHLGEFTANGEISFVEDEGALVGDGAAMFTAANGDQLVGRVSWHVDPPDNEGFSGTQISFHWLDSVTIDGKTFNSTGRFAKAEDRPPGLVVIAIIAILISLLLPAVQP